MPRSARHGLRLRGLALKAVRGNAFLVAVVAGRVGVCIDRPRESRPATIVLVREPGGHDFDIGRAAQNIMLAARTQGVASCPITLHRTAEARQFLGLSADQEGRYAVALGYPTAAAAPRRFGGRKSRDELVRFDRG